MTIADTPATASVIPADVVPLTAEHKAAVLATAPVLAEHGLTVTKRMYETMLGNNPMLRNIFSIPAQKSGAQPLALAQSVAGYAANINDLTPLVPTVVRIAEKHAALGVKPEHYATVAENLIGALQHVLGDAFTPELQTAWYHAYWQLAKIFIDIEADLYAKGAWVGWQKFEVTKHVDESGTIKSFTLVPVDKSMLPLKPYKAGQFITIRVWVDELGCYQNRHYSLSDAPNGEFYRITVKREDAGSSDGPIQPAGLVSTVLHNLPVGGVVEAAFPAGSFVLPEEQPENFVLFSAGVGITPNLSILNTLSKEDPANGPRISWIQGTRGAHEHVFKDHVQSIADRSNGRVQNIAYYSETTENAKGVFAGRIDVATIDKSRLALDDPKALYYICGPSQFMADVKKGLKDLDIDEHRIIVEAFRAGEI